MMNIIMGSVIFVVIGSVLSVNNKNWTNDVRKNVTVNELNGIRFQRILQRKKRFLIFPPGSAIVTTISFTKTLIPKSPSGINMIGECDIFYPLQTNVADWYPMKEHPPPFPPAPPLPPAQELSSSFSQQSGNEPLNEPQPMPISNQNNDSRPPPPIGVPSPFTLPSDQEIGVKPESIISDPNFNTGSHPGEIYVNGKMRKVSAQRYYSQHLNYYGLRNPYQHSRLHELPQPEDVKQDTFSKNDFYRRPSVANGKSSNKIHSRGARERRDIFDQLESLMAFDKFDTKSCILRMICESKHYLLPPGKSLFHDIFRVLFTVPIEDGPIDDYVLATQASENDCNSSYSKRCQFSILGFLISKDRRIL